MAKASKKTGTKSGTRKSAGGGGTVVKGIKGKKAKVKTTKKHVTKRVRPAVTPVTPEPTTFDPNAW